jgi:hypothetical protein
MNKIMSKKFIDILLIANSHLLIENNHLNLFNIYFDDEKLEKALNNMIVPSFICNMVTNTCISIEITDKQKQILKNKFPNLETFIKED